MRKFKPVIGPVVDLDDAKTYKHIKAKSLSELDDLMFKEIGQALIYMNYFYPKRFTYFGEWDQRVKVENLIKKFVSGRKKNIKNKKWYKEQIFLFQNETENMI